MGRPFLIRTPPPLWKGGLQHPSFFVLETFEVYIGRAQNVVGSFKRTILIGPVSEVALHRGAVD